MAKSKHNVILEYIEKLPEGAKISVRQISSYLNVSEGTSYRAIKSAEKDGLVKTIERVGTIRVIRNEDHLDGHLTFNQVNRVIQGQVLTGTSFLEREITRFVIGAMAAEEIESYLESGAILIVGNREEAQYTAIENGAGILITGGFGASEEIIKRAEASKLPVISTSYDTFSVASVIQRELYSLSLSNSLTTAKDLMIKQNDYSFDIEKSRYRYTVMDKVTLLIHEDKYLGAVKSSDLKMIDASNYQGFLIPDIEASSISTLQRIRQIMSWQQLNIVPVVEDSRLLGIVHRRDVFKNVETPKLEANVSTDELVSRNIMIEENKIHITVMSFMTDELGTMTQGSHMDLIERAVKAVLSNYDINSYHIDSMNVMNLKLIQLNQELILEGQVIDIGDQFIRLEVVTASDEVVYSKVSMLVQYYKK